MLVPELEQELRTHVFYSMAFCRIFRWLDICIVKSASMPYVGILLEDSSLNYPKQQRYCVGIILDMDSG